MKQMEFTIDNEEEALKDLGPEIQEKVVKLMARILLKISSQQEEENHDDSASENY